MLADTIHTAYLTLESCSYVKVNLVAVRVVDECPNPIDSLVCVSQTSINSTFPIVSTLAQLKFPVHVPCWPFCRCHGTTGINRSCFNLMKGAWIFFLISTHAYRLKIWSDLVLRIHSYLRFCIDCFLPYQAVLVLLCVVAPFVVDCEPLLFWTAVLWLESILDFEPWTD